MRPVATLAALALAATGCGGEGDASSSDAGGGGRAGASPTAQSEPRTEAEASTGSIPALKRCLEGMPGASPQLEETDVPGAQVALSGSTETAFIRFAVFASAAEAKGKAPTLTAEGVPAIAEGRVVISAPEELEGPAALCIANTGFADGDEALDGARDPEREAALASLRIVFGRDPSVTVEQRCRNATANLRRTLIDDEAASDEDSFERCLTELDGPPVPDFDVDGPILDEEQAEDGFNPDPNTDRDLRPQWKFLFESGSGCGKALVFVSQDLGSGEWETAAFSDGPEVCRDGLG